MTRRIAVGEFKLGPAEKSVLRQVIDSGRLSEGHYTFDFEKAWARYIGTRYCVAVNSGTSALIAALLALKKSCGLRDGARVLTSPLTFIATVNAVVFAGFKPVFCDVDPHTFVITPHEVEAAFKREKDIAAVLPVHLMGYPADMEAITAIAGRHGAQVMEDAAQAHGTTYHGRKMGSFGRMGAFSFYIAHNIQAGEMGAVTTDDEGLFRLLKKIKAHGRMCECRVCTRAKGVCPQRSTSEDEDIDPRFFHDTYGLNFKTMEFQAALGYVQLRKADTIFAKRNAHVRYLNEGLADLRRHLTLPVFSEQVSYLAYPIVVKEGGAYSRLQLRRALEEAGVETRPLFGCIPLQQPAYGCLKKQYEDLLPHAAYAGRNGFYIGCHQYLTKKDLEYVIKTFHRIVR